MRLFKIKPELARKSIHFIGVCYIPLYLYAGKDITILAVLLLTALAAILEILKLKFDVIPYPYFLLRDYELKGIGSYLYTGVSVSIITILLPMEACFAGIANSIVGDGAAGLAKIKMCKSWIVTPVLFVSSLLTLLAVSHLINLSIYAIILSCIGGTAADNFSRVRGHYINDNFSIPLVSAVVYRVSLMLIT